MTTRYILESFGRTGICLLTLAVVSCCSAFADANSATEGQEIPDRVPTIAKVETPAKAEEKPPVVVRLKDGSIAVDGVLYVRADLVAQEMQKARRMILDAQQQPRPLTKDEERRIAKQNTYRVNVNHTQGALTRVLFGGGI